jgi:hypothetical protein
LAVLTPHHTSVAERNLDHIEEVEEPDFSADGTDSEYCDDCIDISSKHLVSELLQSCNTADPKPKAAKKVKVAVDEHGSFSLDASFEVSEEDHFKFPEESAGSGEAGEGPSKLGRGKCQKITSKKYQGEEWWCHKNEE